MPIEQIISIIVFIVVLVLIWGIFKSLFKLMFIAGIIISLLIAINLFFIYQDFKDLRENFTVSEKKIILVDDNKVLTGLLMGEEIDFLMDSQLEAYSSSLINNNYEKILGNSYKLMVFDIDIISKLDSDLDFGVIQMTTDEAVSTLRSDFASPEEKASLFSILLADEILSSTNPILFLTEFKNGNIMIYPETILFKTVKFIPLSLIKDVAGKVLYKTKEKAETLVVE